MEYNFRDGTRQFVGEMIASKTDPQLREWILSDMSDAPPNVAISAMNEMMTRPIDFNKALEKAILMLTNVPGPGHDNHPK